MKCLYLIHHGQSLANTGFSSKLRYIYSLSWLMCKADSKFESEGNGIFISM